MTGVIGFTLLLVGGGWLGYGHSHQLGQRIWAVTQLAEGLYQMEREMTLRLTPLPTLFQNKTLPFGDIFCRCGEGIALGEPVSQCWGTLVENLPLIGQEERNLLLPLGGILGRFEGDVQGEALRRVADGLRRREIFLRGERDRLRAVYPALGLTAGAFLGIFLL